MSISGDTAIVGAFYDDDKGNNSGSAYIFSRDQGGADNWGEAKKLTASDGAADDRFGNSVSISGNTAIVGAPQNDDNGNDSGSAYIFSRDQGGADNWGEVKKLTSSDGAAGDDFGISVSISGSTAIVGAWEDDWGRAGLELYFTGRQELDENPYRSVSEPHFILGFLIDRRFGPIRLFLNAENILDTRQTAFDPLLRPAQSETSIGPGVDFADPRAPGWGGLSAFGK